MSISEQMQTNGGEHLTYCVKCYKTFYTKYGTLECVKKAAKNHCYDNGGPSKGHRYVILY